MNDILKPLQLAAGSHEEGSGMGCAMNVISWENGDTKIYRKGFGVSVTERGEVNS